MATYWILKFLPYNSSGSIEVTFDREDDANAGFDVCVEAAENGASVRFVDCFGVTSRFKPDKGSLVLTNTLAGAKYAKTIHEANQEAVKEVGGILNQLSPTPSMKFQ